MLPDDAHTTPLPKLVAANPYATFAKVAAILHPSARPAPSIHPTAQIDATAKVAQSASIGAFAVIGADATIGERVVIEAQCVIGESSTLGDDVVLHAGAILYPRTVVGERSTIHGGAVIGADGFGMAEEAGRWVRIPQIGRVAYTVDPRRTFTIEGAARQNGDGFLITAYPTDAVKEGESVWPK